jgi:uncharacterized membrane protein YbhN (UPF0104 family)
VSTGRWRMALWAAVALAGTAGVVWLIDEAARNADLVSRLRGANAGWLAVCALGEILAYAGFVLAYQAMARVCGGPQLPASIVLRVVGLSFGAFSVATAIGGLSVDFWALRQAGEDPVHASARVIALETLRWAILALATCVAGVLVLLGVGHRMTWIVAAAWWAVTAVCFAGGLWVSSPAHRASFTEPGGRLRWALGIAVTALVYIRRLRVDRSGVRRRAVGGAALFWAGELVCAWAALRAFGTRIGVAPLLLGYTTGYAATALPLPFGGAGGVDAALTGGFVLAGAPLGSALLGAVTFRIFSFWLPAVGAILSLLTAHGLTGRLREIGHVRNTPPEQTRHQR